MKANSRILDRFHTEPRFMVLLKRVILAFLAVHVVLASYSGYRAIVQIQHLELRSAGRVLHDGSTIHADVTSSGRTIADMAVEMLQGARAETLAVRVLPPNHDPAYDPRSQHAAVSVVLTTAILARFQAGPAVIRATARGRSQWLRVPPPEVRELSVALR